MDTKLLIVGFRYIKTKFNCLNYGFSFKLDIFMESTTILKRNRK